MIYIVKTPKSKKNKHVNKAISWWCALSETFSDTWLMAANYLKNMTLLVQQASVGMFQVLMEVLSLTVPQSLVPLPHLCSVIFAPHLSQCKGISIRSSQTRGRHGMLLCLSHTFLLATPSTWYLCSYRIALFPSDAVGKMFESSLRSGIISWLLVGAVWGQQLPQQCTVGYTTENNLHESFKCSLLCQVQG